MSRSSSVPSTSPPQKALPAIPSVKASNGDGIPAASPRTEHRTPKMNPAMLNLSDAHFYSWTSNAAFEKYLFRDKSLNQLFRTHLVNNVPDRVRLLNFFTELNKFIRVNVVKRRENA